jgi:hypothetical protein
MASVIGKPSQRDFSTSAREGLVVEKDVAVGAGAGARILEHALLRQEGRLGVDKIHQCAPAGDRLLSPEHVEKAHLSSRSLSGTAGLPQFTPDPGLSRPSLRRRILYAENGPAGQSV